MVDLNNLTERQMIQLDAEAEKRGISYGELMEELEYESLGEEW